MKVFFILHLIIKLKLNVSTYVRVTTIFLFYVVLFYASRGHELRLTVNNNYCVDCRCQGANKARANNQKL